MVHEELYLQLPTIVMMYLFCTITRKLVNLSIHFELSNKHTICVTLYLQKMALYLLSRINELYTITDALKQHQVALWTCNFLTFFHCFHLPSLQN